MCVRESVIVCMCVCVRMTVLHEQVLKKYVSVYTHTHTLTHTHTHVHSNIVYTADVCTCVYACVCDVGGYTKKSTRV